MKKISEMLAAASARKAEIVGFITSICKQLSDVYYIKNKCNLDLFLLNLQVNSRISILQDLVAKNSHVVEQGVQKVCEARSESRNQWASYIEEAESRFNDVCDNLNLNQTSLQEIAAQWYVKEFSV